MNGLLLATGNPTLIIAIIVALIILIYCSSFFSSSETAFSTANQVRLKTFVEEKKKGAKKALWIAENYDRALTTILVGNNFVNIAATTLAGILFNVIIPSESIAGIANTVIMTILVLIFGEILPKCRAKEKPELYTLRYAGVLHFIMKMLYPIVVCFMKLRNVLSKKTEDETPKVTEEELETIIETMVDDGEIDSDDAELMRGMIDSNNRTVYDIMVPRVDIIAIDIESTIEEIKEIFFKYKFSRIPVFKDDKDHIIGILNERDFFTALIEHKKINIEKMVSKPLYVSMEMKSDDLIRKMQKEKKHFAIVADEYGGTGGIVTLEDAIEVITGEIYDEHDDVDDIKDYIKQVEENQYIIDAEMPLEDLFELLELGKAPESRYSNIGGFLYGLAEELPTLGQNFDYDANVYKQDEDGMTEEFLIKLHFSVIEVMERRIKKIKLIVDEPINQEVEDKDEE